MRALVAPPARPHLRFRRHDTDNNTPSTSPPPVSHDNESYTSVTTILRSTSSVRPIFSYKHVPFHLNDQQHGPAHYFGDLHQATLTKFGVIFFSRVFFWERTLAFRMRFCSINERSALKDSASLQTCTIRLHAFGYPAYAANDLHSHSTSGYFFILQILVTGLYFRVTRVGL
jgi:hypothetical protein